MFAYTCVCVCVCLCLSVCVCMLNWDTFLGGGGSYIRWDSDLTLSGECCGDNDRGGAGCMCLC